MRLLIDGLLALPLLNGLVAGLTSIASRDFAPGYSLLMPTRWLASLIARICGAGQDSITIGGIECALFLVGFLALIVALLRQGPATTAR